MVLVEVMLAAAVTYVALGILFAIPFLVRGIYRVDSQAHGATSGFRLIILPGVIALWPLLAARWVRGEGDPPEERNAHRSAA